MLVEDDYITRTYTQKEKNSSTQQKMMTCL